MGQLKMKLTKQKLKEIIMEELSGIKEGGFAGHYEREPEYENLVNDLSDLIKRSIEEDGMDPAEARRAAEEAMDIEIGLGEEEEPLRLGRPEHDPLDTSPRGIRNRRRLQGRGIKNYPLDK